MSKSVLDKYKLSYEYTDQFKEIKRALRELPIPSLFAILNSLKRKVKDARQKDQEQ